MRYDDKYDNHFLHIECGRSRFGDFAAYTVNALAKPGMPAEFVPLGTALKAAVADFLGDVVTRIGSGGTTQANTKDEDDQWDDIHDFLTATDVKIIRPAYFDRTDLSTIYPNKMSGLTASPQPKRLANFEAYTKALEAAHDIITDAPGKAARKLLEEYRKVATTKDQGESTTMTIIEQLGPKAVAVCWALWDVHCTGLSIYSRQPMLANALFNYGLLPTKKRGAKPKNV